MVTNAARWAAALATALLASCAADQHSAGSAGIGKVQGVFVERYAGVFVDRRSVPDMPDRPLWVLVAFDHRLDDGRTFATALLPDDPGVEAGDLVQLRFAAAEIPATDAASAHNQVVAVIAKHDTAQARAFGAAPGQALSQLPVRTSAMP